MARVVTTPGIAKAIAKALPVLGTVLAIKDILDAVRCREGFGGAGECDDGQPQIPSQQWRGNNSCTGGSQAIGATVAAAHNVHTSCQQAYWATQYGSGFSVEAQAGTCSGSVCSGGAFRILQGGNLFTLAGGWDNSYTLVQTMICPTVALPDGGSLTSSPGADGQCPTLTYTPAPQQEIADKIATHAAPGAVVGVLPEILARDVPIEHDAPDYSNDAPPQAVRDTTQHPDGSTTVKDTSYPWVDYPDGYGWTPRVQTREFPPGAVIPPLGDGSGGGVIVEGPGAAPVEFKTCGLPGRPPCKIDEEGTPPPVPPTVFNPVEDPSQPLRDIITQPPAADLAFSWAFQLPAACQVIALPAFGAALPQLDLCEYQPMIHDIMSVIWLLFGVFIMWGQVTRALS